MKVKEETAVSDTFLTLEHKEKLIANNIKTIKELLNFSIIELLSFDNLSLYDVYMLKAFLNQNKFHMIGEELIEIPKNFVWTPEIDLLIKHCDILIKQRNKLRGKKEFQAEEIVLLQQIFSIFDKLRNFECKKEFEENTRHF